MRWAVFCKSRRGWQLPGLLGLSLATVSPAALPLMAQEPARPAIAEAVAAGALMDQTGRAVSMADFFGKPSLLLFGFTSCPSICPTTLSEVAGRMADLGELADRMNFIFVSADPERDTPDILRDYLGSFDKRIVGLTGREADIGALARAVGAQVQKVPQADGGYTVDHSVQAFLMDRDGRRTGILVLGPGTDGQRANARLRALLGEAGH
jgi:protein SCO1/2